MSGAASAIIRSWQQTTLVRRERHDPGGVPLLLRGTCPYPALSVDVGVKKFEGDSLHHKAVITVSADSI